MKTILLMLLSVMIALPMTVPITAHAENGMMGDDMMRKKRYRYRNRTHRVQVAANIVPWSQNSDKNLFIDLDLMYGYNAGFFEIGPNLRFMSPGDGKIKVNLFAGLWGEFNIIKNTRKEQFVPALGLKANYVNMNNKHSLLLSPYLALKYFPASRTGLILNINYEIVTPFDRLFSKMEMGLAVSVAYAHYFHF